MPGLGLGDEEPLGDTWPEPVQEAAAAGAGGARGDIWPLVTVAAGGARPDRLDFSWSASHWR